MENLQAKYPQLISNARGKGLMCAFDLPNGEIRGQFQEKLFENQVIILVCGPQSLRFRPHLNVTKEDIDTALNTIEKVIQESYM